MKSHVECMRPVAAAVTFSTADFAVSGTGRAAQLFRALAGGAEHASGLVATPAGRTASVRSRYPCTARAVDASGKALTITGITHDGAVALAEGAGEKSLPR